MFAEKNIRLDFKKEDKGNDLEKRRRNIVRICEYWQIAIPNGVPYEEFRKCFKMARALSPLFCGIKNYLILCWDKAYGKQCSKMVLATETGKDNEFDF